MNKGLSSKLIRIVCIAMLYFFNPDLVCLSSCLHKETVELGAHQQAACVGLTALPRVGTADLVCVSSCLHNEVECTFIL